MDSLNLLYFLNLCAKLKSVKQIKTGRVKFFCCWFFHYLCLGNIVLLLAAYDSPYLEFDLDFLKNINTLLRRQVLEVVAGTKRYRRHRPTEQDTVPQYVQGFLSP